MFKFNNKNTIFTHFSRVCIVGFEHINVSQVTSSEYEPFSMKYAFKHKTFNLIYLKQNRQKKYQKKSPKNTKEGDDSQMTLLISRTAPLRNGSSPRATKLIIRVLTTPVLCEIIDKKGHTSVKNNSLTIHKILKTPIQLEMCPCSEFFGPHFPVFELNTERCSVSLHILYSVRMRENTDQKNSQYRHFSRGHNIGDKLHIRDPNYKNWL